MSEESPPRPRVRPRPPAGVLSPAVTRESLHDALMGVVRDREARLVGDRETRPEPSMADAILSCTFRTGIAPMERLLAEVARRNATDRTGRAWNIDTLCDELLNRAIREFLPPGAK